MYDAKKKRSVGVGEGEGKIVLKNRVLNKQFCFSVFLAPFPRSRSAPAFRFLDTVPLVYFDEIGSCSNFPKIIQIRRRRNT